MPPLQNRIKNAVNKSSGSRFWVKKTITSSAITTSAQDLTSVATGQLAILQVIEKTDGTGLAGGTNFEILSNNAKGVVNILVETVANLGANITKVLSGVPAAGDTTTSDAGATVTAVPTVLEAGKKLQYKNTAGAGTGAGTIDVFVQFERIDENAQCVAV